MKVYLCKDAPHPRPPPRGGWHGGCRDWGSVLKQKRHSLRLCFRTATSLSEGGKAASPLNHINFHLPHACRGGSLTLPSFRGCVSSRGNLPVHSSEVLCSIVDSTRRLPRRGVAPPRNDVRCFRCGVSHINFHLPLYFGFCLFWANYTHDASPKLGIPRIYT